MTFPDWLPRVPGPQLPAFKWQEAYSRGQPVGSQRFKVCPTKQVKTDELAGSSNEVRVQIN